MHNYSGMLCIGPFRLSDFCMKFSTLLPSSFLLSKCRNAVYQFLTGFVFELLNQFTNLLHYIT